MKTLQLRTTEWSTGPGGGHAFYFPIETIRFEAVVTCFTFCELERELELPSLKLCWQQSSGCARSFGYSRRGQSESFGIGLVFLNDNPNEPEAMISKTFEQPMISSTAGMLSHLMTRLTRLSPTLKRNLKTGG